MRRKVKTHSSVATTHTKESVPLLGEVREDERPFLRQQFVLLHSELLQQLTPGHREDGLEQAAAEHVRGFVARQAVVALGDVAVTQPPGTRRKGNTPLW